MCVVIKLLYRLTPTFRTIVDVAKHYQRINDKTNGIVLSCL